MNRNINYSKFIAIACCLILVCSMAVILNHEPTSNYLKAAISSEPTAEELSKEDRLVLKIKKNINERISKTIKQQMDDIVELKQQFQVNLLEMSNKNDVCIQEFTKLKEQITTNNQKPIFKVDIKKYNSNFYSKKIFTFESTDETNKFYDPSNNDVVYLAGIHKELGHGRSYKEFFGTLDQVEYPRSKTSLSLLISEPSLYEELDSYYSNLFNRISKNEVPEEELKKIYTKITILHCPFLEEKLSVINHATRKAVGVQKVRRKALARLRNFLVTNGIQDEKYSLFLDADVIEIHKRALNIFIEKNVDVATTTVDIKNPDGSIVHHDYDLNSWSGGRRIPNAEQEKKLDEDPNYGFDFGSAADEIHFRNLVKEPEKFGITKDIDSMFELKSVGGAILFAKTEIYKQGVMFPPYYSVGTTWNRIEGWDGVETEGLCYQANSIGYKCWGFPFLTTYHSNNH